MVNKYKQRIKIVGEIAKIIICIFVVSLTSCSSDDESPDDIPFDDTKDSYSILAIGNSLSNDALSYVPFIMKELSPNVNIDFHILYRASTPLDTHWNLISNNNNEYSLERCNTDMSSWYVFRPVLASDILSSRKWDLVILQQGSTKAYSYDETQPYVQKIVSYIKEKNPSVPIAYMFCQSRTSYKTTALKGKTSDEVWELQTKVSDRLLKEGEVDYVIPCGTGIQNARHTSLDALGEKRHLTYDGLHLQEGIPCLLDAYIVTQSLFKFFSIDASIVNSNLQITQQWVYDMNIPGQHGSVITGMANDYELCKKCALLAIENPDQISMIP